MDDLSPLAQLAVLVIGAVASAIAWMFGQRNQTPPPNPNNGFHAELDILRRDLERVLFAHREALDTRLERQIESIRALIDKGASDAKDDANGIHERLRQTEITVAEMKARIPTRR